MQLQFCRPRIQTDRVPAGSSSAGRTIPLCFFLRLPRHFDLDQFLLRLLFGIEDSVQLCALVTNSLLVDQGTAMVEDLDHSAAAHVQMVFHHCFGLVKDLGNFLDLKSIHFLQQQSKVFFKRKRFGNTRKAKSDVFLDLKIPLRRRFPNVHGFLKKLPLSQHFLPANVGHVFGPSFFGSQQIPRQVGCMLKTQVFNDDSPRKVFDLRIGFDISLLNDILGILHAGGHSRRKDFNSP